jgi:hypothetical protein
MTAENSQRPSMMPYGDKNSISEIPIKNGYQTLMQPNKENSKREVMRQKWSDQLIQDLFAKSQKIKSGLSDVRSDKP